MPLTLVTGRANTGKSDVVREAARRALDRGNAPVVLLPTLPDARRTSREFFEKGLLGSYVSEFDAYLAELWSLHGDGRRPVGPDQRRLLLAEALERTQLVATAPSARRPGFLSMLEQIARSVSVADPGTWDPQGRAEAEIVEVVRAYLAALPVSGLVEPAEAVRVLAADPPALPGPLLLHRFSDLSAAQEAFVTGCALSGEEVLVTLPWEEGFPPTEGLDALVRRLEALEPERRHMPVPARTVTHPELERVGAGLFGTPEIGEPSDAVRFGSAAGPEAEAALVAAAAAAAAAEFGPEQVAVVFRDASAARDRLERAFATVGIAVDIDVSTPFASTPFGRACAQLLEAVIGDGDRRSLVAFLGGPYAPVEESVLEMLDARWRRGRTDGVARLIRDCRAAAPAAGRMLALARSLVAAPLTPESPQRWKELADTLLSTRYTSSETQEQSAAVTDGAAHRALMEVVNGLAGLPGRCSGAAELMAALAGSRVRAGAIERPGHVQVTDARRLRSRRFDAVIVGGLSAAGFPVGGRESVHRTLIDTLLPTPRIPDAAAARLLFYNVVTRARRSLVLIRQSVDEKGDPVRPSPVWEEMLDLYRDPATGDEEPRIAVFGPELGAVGLAGPASSPERAAARAVARPPRRRVRRGHLGDPAVLAELAARDVFSVTELERYTNCPYRWFYERTVRPEELERALGPLETGKLAHEALRRFYDSIEDALGDTRVTPENREEAARLAVEGFDALVADDATPGPTGLVEEEILAVARAGVANLVMADAYFLPGMSPTHREWPFGGQDGPVTIGGVGVRGRVDRIDTGDGHAVVIDYKTGKPPEPADIRRGRSFQVFVYAAIVRQELGLDVVGAVYRGLRTEVDRWAVAERDGALPQLEGVRSVMPLEEAVGSALRAVEVAAEGIRAGRIDADPAVGNLCGWCPAAPSCPREGRA